MLALSRAIDALDAMPEFLDTALDIVSGDDLRFRSSADAFSLVEHACHLRDLEREGYLVRVRRMGLLWLSTVPLTNALVAQIFGLRHVSMLSGVVFFGHQIGSFCGAWLGGVIVTRNGSYDLAWWISIGLGVFAAIVCAPINERPLARPAAAAA